MANGFSFNRRAMREILSSDEVELALFVIADKIKDACDPDGHLGPDAYVAVSDKGRVRARAAVIAVTAHARNSNAKYNTLIRALGSGRG